MKTNTATAQPAFTQAAEQTDAPANAVQPMGRYYIQNAAPIKGSKPDAQGNCFYMLKCFQIPEDATPGQVRAMEFSHKDAQYRVYHGLMSRHHGDVGMIVGYIDDCFGRDMDYPGAGDIKTRVMTQIDGTLMPRPTYHYDTARHPFEPHAAKVQNIDETIATMRSIDAIRSPRKQQHEAYPNCRGG